ncbi:SDR family NAD(P)-dependent oxidoreductase [Streptococcus sp. ZJ93]|uniref:SDR family NAD(P)-dependent oxidoreductase n=1 Tax=Streptococcus handemini TaxID=3161188 RepID=UPI0032EC87C8
MSKTILITGASSGIGKALAEKYAQLGWNVILVAKNALVLEQFANDLRKETGIFILPIIQDLRQVDVVWSLFQRKV